MAPMPSRLSINPRQRPRGGGAGFAHRERTGARLAACKTCGSYKSTRNNRPEPNPGRCRPYPRDRDCPTTCLFAVCKDCVWIRRCVTGTISHKGQEGDINKIDAVNICPRRHDSRAPLGLYCYLVLLLAYLLTNPSAAGLGKANPPPKCLLTAERNGKKRVLLCYSFRTLSFPMYLVRVLDAARLPCFPNSRPVDPPFRNLTITRARKREKERKKMA